MSRTSFSVRNGLRLGALVTVRELETHPEVRQRYAALVGAAASFAGVQIRNLATVGGNVCNASPAGDTLPALLAFEAQCRIVGPEGERWAPLEEFFTGPGSTILRRGEILAELRLPTPPRDTGSLYIKHSPRGAMDIATVGVASVVSLQDRGQVCADVKIALGAVAPTPVRARSAEELLRGQTITPELLTAAASEAQRSATPIDDVRGSAAHRSDIAGVLVERTLTQAVAMARGGAVSFEENRRMAIGMAP
jgi:carbon-monoxide dehydrogenase medium subunit